MLRLSETGWRTPDTAQLKNVEWEFQSLISDLAQLLNKVKDASSSDIRYDGNCGCPGPSPDLYAPKAHFIDPIRVGHASFWPFGGPSETSETLNDWFEGRKNLNDYLKAFIPTGGCFNPLTSTAPGQPLQRLFDPSLGRDRLTDPSLPGAREISNAVVRQEGNIPNSKGLSDLFWAWGQFIDHDLTLVKTDPGQRADIPVPKGDPVFDPMGTGTTAIRFDRSRTTSGIAGVGEPVNAISGLMDGSMVYGSTAEETNGLRSFEGGRLRTSAGDLLPTDGDGRFVAGDERVNEQPGLSSLHTIFMREHNRIADKISAANPKMSDEQVFQAARKVVVGEIQSITYNEFLPLLLGSDKAGRMLPPSGKINPQISNAFATAAYRFGHSMVNSNIPITDANGNVKNVALRDAFENPDLIKQNGVDGILRGQAGQVAQALDPFIVEDLRSALFGMSGEQGLDLAALNIQRGRDHGLPSWNDARESMGLRRVTSFNDPIFPPHIAQKLASVYDHPDQIDMWIGGLAERPSGNALVGETFGYLIADQFNRTRAGDPNFYEWALHPQTANWVHNVRLADIIRWNTDVRDIDRTAMIATDNNYW